MKIAFQLKRVRSYSGYPRLMAIIQLNGIPVGKIWLERDPTHYTEKDKLAGGHRYNPFKVLWGKYPHIFRLIKEALGDRIRELYNALLSADEGSCVIVDLEKREIAVQ